MENGNPNEGSIQEAAAQRPVVVPMPDQPLEGPMTGLQYVALPSTLIVVEVAQSDVFTEVVDPDVANLADVEEESPQPGPSTSQQIMDLRNIIFNKQQELFKLRQQLKELEKKKKAEEEAKEAELAAFREHVKTCRMGDVELMVGEDGEAKEVEILETYSHKNCFKMPEPPM